MKAIQKKRPLKTSLDAGSSGPMWTGTAQRLMPWVLGIFTLTCRDVKQMVSCDREDNMKNYGIRLRKNWRRGLMLIMDRNLSAVSINGKRFIKDLIRILFQTSLLPTIMDIVYPGRPLWAGFPKTFLKITKKTGAPTTAPSTRKLQRASFFPIRSMM